MENVALNSLLGSLTQSLHEQRHKRDIKQSHLPAYIHQHEQILWFFSYVQYALIRFIIFLLVESDRYLYSYRKISHWPDYIFSALKILQTSPHNHNNATTKSSHRLSRWLETLIASCHYVQPNYFSSWPVRNLFNRICYR